MNGFTGFDVLGAGGGEVKSNKFFAQCCRSADGLLSSFSVGIWVVLDRFPRISGKDMFQERLFVILKHRRDNRGVIDKPRSRNRIRDDVVTLRK
jgi:hypothetical protein